mmetsp:Transcript_11878/g.27511  ORF Transcript_11878/g.27511 Transcript_11878/m.27511 type:complete len:138 (-) Transcript_11878:257-670(-)
MHHHEAEGYRGNLHAPQDVWFVALCQSSFSGFRNTWKEQDVSGCCCKTQISTESPTPISLSETDAYACCRKDTASSTVQSTTVRREATRTPGFGIAPLFSAGLRLLAQNKRSRIGCKSSLPVPAVATGTCSKDPIAS